MSKVLIDTPSGTPAMPVKAYYHEAPNEYGGFNKSVGLEVRKEFNDAPLVLEADALARVACLEGEIAKRDETIARLEADNRSKNGSMKAFGEQIAGLQKAVRNRERLVGLRDARILELESQYQRDVYGLNNEGDPIGGDPAGGYANDNARLRAELSAIKAQEPVGWYTEDHLDDKSATTYSWTVAERWVEKGWPVSPLYAAPVSEAKAQGVVMPRDIEKSFLEWASAQLQAPTQLASYMAGADEVTSLNAATSAPAADAGLVDMYRHLQTVTPYRFKKIQDASVTDGGDVLYFHKDRFDAALLADMAAHCAAKGVV